MEIERQGAPNLKCGSGFGIPSYWRTSSAATGSMQHLQPSWRTLTTGNMGHMGQRVAPPYNSCSGIADNGKSWGAALPLRENSISKSSAPAGGVEHMAPPCSNIVIALRQAGPSQEWKDGSTTLLHAGSQPRALHRASDGPNADQVGEELEQATTGATSGTLSTATSTPQTHPSPLSSPVAEAVPTGEEAGIQDSQRDESPLGFMFRPELDKSGVVAVVSEILCRPGFTVGPDDERRLKRSVESGRIDVHNMSRLLRWLAGRRAARELSERGIEFVIPRAQPYTSGQGMTRLMEEVVARGHPAGTNFVVCFSSRFDACSGAIRGRLINEDVPVSSSDSVSDAPTTAEPGPSCAGGDRSAVGGDARTCPSLSAGVDRTPSMSPQGDRRRHAATSKGKKTASKVRSGVSTSSGVRAAAVAGGSSRNSMTHGSCATTPGARVVALLLDEKPRHRHCGGAGAGGSGSGSGGPAAGWDDDEGEGVRGMRVAEWVDAWGECDGPMLAAWVFPRNDQGVAARQ
ncbi:unnamed protein product [Ectocarpus sp. 6 AP-2014]